MARSSPVRPVVGLSVVRNSCGAACVRNCMFSSPRGYVSRNSERTKLKRRLGIGKRVATCHLTAASESELKRICSGNTWCFRDAVPSQTFSPGTSESFCFLSCVGESCIVDCGCFALARRKNCPGEHADVSYVYPRFHASTGSTDRFKKEKNRIKGHGRIRHQRPPPCIMCL